MEINKLNKFQALKFLGIITSTDGYLQINENRCRWELVTIPNIELHQISKQLFHKAFNISVPTFYRIKNRIYRSTEIASNKYRPFLKNLERIAKQDFKFLLNEKTEIKELAFRLAMDLEGSISTKFCIKRKFYKNKQYFQFQFEPELKLSFTDKSKIRNWIEILKDIGLNFTIHKDLRFESCIGGLRTSNKEYILKFYDMGGFLTNGKISKSSTKNISNNNGISKNIVLKTVCHILRNKTDLYSKYFQSMNEAKSYRKWFIHNIFLPLRNEGLKNGPARI